MEVVIILSSILRHTKVKQIFEQYIYFILFVYSFCWFCEFIGSGIIVVFYSCEGRGPDGKIFYNKDCSIP